MPRGEDLIGKIRAGGIAKYGAAAVGLLAVTHLPGIYTPSEDNLAELERIQPFKLGLRRILWAI